MWTFCSDLTRRHFKKSQRLVNQRYHQNAFLYPRSEHCLPGLPSRKRLNTCQLLACFKADCKRLPILSITAHMAEDKHEEAALVPCSEGTFVLEQLKRLVSSSMKVTNLCRCEPLSTNASSFGGLAKGFSVYHAPETMHRGGTYRQICRSFSIFTPVHQTP
jgi:hypothetical protein